MLLIALCAGCSRQDTLQPVERIAIGTATLSDLVEGSGPRIWLSTPGGAIALLPDSASAYRVQPEIGRGSTILGEAAGRLILLDDGAVVAMHPDSVAAYPLLRGVETALLATTQNLLLQSIRYGEIVVSPLDSLRPAWGWADVGAMSTGLAVSPEGDRLYQSTDLVGEGGPATLLVRDLLSGRTLQTIEIGEPLRALTVTDAGDLIGVAWDGEGSNAAVKRLNWAGGTMRTTWSSQVQAPKSLEELRLAISRDGRRIALVGGNEEAGLTLLDGETGFIIAGFDGVTRDAVFDERGRLYAATDSAVLRF